MKDINRRAALAGLLGVAPLASALPAFAQRTAPPTGSLLTPDEEPEVAITLDTWTDTYGRPTAAVKLNGQGPFSFMVDTGSTATVMAERVALTLGIERAGNLTVAGATGTAVKPYTIVDELQTGAVTRKDIRIAILSDDGLARGDGILGADVFAGKKLVFAIRDKTVRIEPSRRQTRIASRGNIRLRNGTLAEVDGRVGKIPAKLMLDTGADYCIANPVLGEALARSYPHQQRIPKARVTGVTGHRIFGEFIQLPPVDVRAFSVEGSGAIIADAPIFNLWELTDEPAMIVGVDLLSRLASFTIDYGARQFDAELASNLMALNQAAFG